MHHLKLKHYWYSSNYKKITRNTSIAKNIHLFIVKCNFLFTELYQSAITTNIFHWSRGFIYSDCIFWSINKGINRLSLKALPWAKVCLLVFLHDIRSRKVFCTIVATSDSCGGLPSLVEAFFALWAKRLIMLFWPT